MHPSGDWEAMATWGGPEGIMPVNLAKPEHKRWNGRRLTEIAAEVGKDWLETAMDLLVAEEQLIFTVYFSMSEDNLRLQLQQPWIKISTDAGGLDPAWASGDGPTHPRAYGTYPRVLAKYVRDEQVITLEECVRKMSSAVADRLNIRERGMLRAGYFADVIIFDPATVSDHATYEDSHRLSTGIRDVWVNGTRVVADGTHTGATPGQIVRPN
jgi:dihydroorotase/N-acyl-D-amino-acid deacylase